MCKTIEQDQLNTLMYTLGKQVEDVILKVFKRNGLRSTYSINDYFGLRRNVRAEIAKFNKLVQGGDSLDVLINKLYPQA